MISPEYQKVLYSRSPYNIVRIEHGMVLPGDSPDNNRHTRAAAIFTEWRNNGVLQFDALPSIYVHEQFFGEGCRLKRRGLVARVRLEPPDRGTVLPHENTVSGIKSDRLVLLKACRTNISPIMVLYFDRSGEITDILDGITKADTVADFTVPEGERHRLWAVADAGVLNRLSGLLASQKLYIADGHHRYETSLAYQQERCGRNVPGPGPEGFNFIMMTLISFDDPGLVVYPIHRMVSGLTPAALERLRGAFENVFDVIYVGIEKLRDGAQLLKDTGGLFAVVGLMPGRTAICRLRADLDVDSIMPRERSSTYRRLPVSLLHHLVLDGLSRYSEWRGDITYTHDSMEALEAALKGLCSVAIIMPPADPLTIKAVADAGDRMPGKSTYFYPKLPTGLVLNYLEI